MEGWSSYLAILLAINQVSGTVSFAEKRILIDREKDLRATTSNRTPNIPFCLVRERHHLGMRRKPHGSRLIVIQ